MKCAWVQEHLLLYLAESLGPAESARVVEHIEGCDDCTEMMNQLAESWDSVREAVRTTAQPPASLDARILECVRAMPRGRLPWSVQLPVWSMKSVIAFCGCALLLVMAGYELGRWNSGSVVHRGVPEATATHPMLDLAALADTHRTRAGRAGQADADALVVAARLTRQTGLNVTPPNLKDHALRLKDSSVVQMHHIPVAVLHYDWNGVNVSLAQADGVRLASPSSLHEMRDHGRCFLVHQHDGLTYIFWCEGLDNYVLVANLPPPQLFALACKMCANLQHV